MKLFPFSQPFSHYRTAIGKLLLEAVVQVGIGVILGFSCLTVHAAVQGIYVVDGTVGLLKLDPVTGIRSTVSDFSNVNQGELGSIPFNLAIETSGNVLVVDPGVNKLFRVNPVTGQRTVVSDFSNPAQGPVADSVAGNGIAGIAVDASGGILMTAVGAGSPDPYSSAYRIALLRVNPVSGQRTMLSDFGDPNQGPLGGQCTLGIAIELTGKILVTDCNNLSGVSGGLLFRIDPSTGQRTIVSDFSDPSQGETAQSPHGIAVDNAGKILVVAPFFKSFPGGALFKIDPVIGTRVLLSDFGNAAQGATGTLLRSVAVESTGAILVADQDVDDIGSGGAVFRVNPVTGQRTVLSNFADIALGPGRTPTGVALTADKATVAFAAFNSDVVLSRIKSGFLAGKGIFTLGSTSDGIAPVKELVVFSLSDKNGVFFRQTLPKQSFKAIGNSVYVFNSKVGAAGINSMVISPTGKNKQYFYSVYIGKQDFRGADKPPIKVSLAVGSDSGSDLASCKSFSTLLICH